MQSLKKIALPLIAAVAFLAQPALATVNVTAGPTSLVTSPITAHASSTPIGLFSFTLGQDAGETLSSVTVTVNNVGGSTATGSDFAALSVYKDDGNGSFDSAVDALAGTQATVNVGSATTVSIASNNTLAASGSKFFVALATGPSWSAVSPADSVTATIAADGIVTSANSPTVTAATTATITADSAAPSLSSAMAKNTGGTDAKEAGDTIDLVFNESTNKPAITAANVASVFTLNNSHSFLDGAGSLGATSWSVDGKTLTVTLSAGTSLPTAAIGDTVTVNGSTVTDLEGNPAAGSQTITGSFAGSNGEGEGDEDEGQHACANALVNGQLYKVGDSATVYLAAGCRLKPFRGAAVFHARGKKFGENIHTLSSLPENVTISDKPVLPAEGTLVKGSDKTVWFVDSHGKKVGFVSANVFARLGFSFGQVQTISDSDLSQIPTGANISSETQHPDGSLLKCGNSAAVFEIIGGMRFPFANVDAFKNRGHAFDHILNVDCGRFRYVQGAPVF